jgi:flagellar biosynthesis protein FlhG
MSDRGIVVTAPEPGAVMNAYSFIKGALFRKLQNIFRRHPEIGPIIDAETKKTESEKTFTIEALADQIKNLSPDMLPLVEEIEKDFFPALVVNKIPEGQKHVLVTNLISLCKERLGLTIEHVGNLPDIPEITDYLLKIHSFLNTQTGKPYLESVQKIAQRIVRPSESVTGRTETKTDFTDEEVDKIISLMETLDDSIFSGTNRSAWKLRMYFKPSEVVNYLISRGVTHEVFYR